MSRLAAGEAAIEVISLEIAGHAFCIEIRAVREIRGWTPATPVPQAAAYVVGVINLRGAVMPILDLRARLGLGATEVTGRHVIVVVQHEERLAGLLVDAVQETMMLQAGQLQPPPAYGEGAESPFVDALVPLEGRILARLSVPSLLPPRSMAAAA